MVAEDPAQIEVAGEITAVGGGFTVTLMLVVSAHVPLDTMTEYVPEEVGVREMEAEVAPVLHEYNVPPDAVSVVLLPWQIDVLPFTTATIFVVTVTVATAVAVHDPAVTVTV